MFGAWISAIRAGSPRRRQNIRPLLNEAASGFFRLTCGSIRSSARESALIRWISTNFSENSIAVTSTICILLHRVARE